MTTDHRTQKHPADIRPAVTLRQAGWALMFVTIYILVAAGAIAGAGLSGLIEFTPLTLIPVFFGGVTGAVLVALYLHLIRRNALSLADFGFRKPGRGMLHLLWQIPVAIITAAGVQGLFLWLLTLAGLDTSSAGASNDALADIGELSLPMAAVVVAVIAVITPLWEEVLFRGAFLDGFSQRFRPAAAVVLSAALFAAVHIALLGFAYLFTLGIALAVLRRIHRNLWAPVFLHMANNSLVAVFVLTLV